MKKLILAAALTAVTFTASAKNRPIDGTPEYILDVEVASLVADYVEALGYSCKSISAFTMSPWTNKKFTLTCNAYRYSYDIEDKGGIWTVTVD